MGSWDGIRVFLTAKQQPKTSLQSPYVYRADGLHMVLPFHCQISGNTELFNNLWAKALDQLGVEGEDTLRDRLDHHGICLVLVEKELGCLDKKCPV